MSETDTSIQKCFDLGECFWRILERLQMEWFKEQSVDEQLFSRVNSYLLYTRRRLAETPQPSFKDIGHAWKSLSEVEKKDYQEEAEKVGVS